MIRDRIRRGLLAPLLTTIIVLALAGAAQAATITVNVTGDPSGSGDCLSANSTSCSLRQAIAAEDGTSGGDTISLPAGTYTLTQGTNLDITVPLTLSGAGVGSTTIDGSHNSGNNEYGELGRILKVDGGAAVAVAIQDLTFSGGNDGTDENFCGGCRTIDLNGGGALFNASSSVTLQDVAFTNDTSFLGGAVSNNAILNMIDVSFTGDGGGIGGGLFSRGGTVTGAGLTFENDATGSTDDAAVYLYGGGNVTLTNTTVTGSGGASSRGGGILNDSATLTLTNDTLAGNNRGSLATNTSGTTSVANTIIADGFSDGDGDCVAPGLSSGATDGTSAKAITTDLGGNLDQDNSCGLIADNGDFPGVDPKLVPIADNGGPTRTEALIAGSPALGDPASSNCPPNDQRGDPRGDGICDIGAFEAQPTDAPSTPTTGSATNVTQSSADLAATINLNGDAGGFHFLYGTSSDQSTWSATPESAAGVVSQDTPVSYSLSGLSPGTTYNYAVVADNSTDSVQSENTGQFTTPAGSPSISEVSTPSVTDTTATIDFTIDPQGADTTYYVKYGTDVLTQQTDAGTALASDGAKQYSATITNLSPATTYLFEVVASNSAAPDGVHSDESSFTTDPQVTGTAGSPVSITDSGSTYFCPQASIVDWSDGQSDQQGQVTCTDNGDGYDYTTTDSHIYDAPGHYLITITYPEFRQSEQYAEISPASSPVVTGISPTSGPTAGGTSVTISGTDFTDAGQVEFGSTPANSFTVDSDTQITALAPPQSAGKVDVTVTKGNATSSTSSADKYTYTAPPPSNPPTTTTQSTTPTPPTTPSAPTVSGGAPTHKSGTGAGVSGVVNPQGGATSAFFQYGLDLSQRGPDSGTTLYDHSTAPQSVGSDTTNHAVTASLTGLIPGGLYHIRLVATNGSGTTYGPDQTFKAAAAAAPPPPVLGKSEDIKPISGTVFIRTRSGQFIPLTGAVRLPSGTVIDALHGSIELLAAVGKGKTEHGIFGGAIFRLTQARAGVNRGLTTLTLLEGLFKGAPSYAICKAHAATDATIASSRALQLLHASAHGKFRTKGRYSAATVRGTKWTIADRCDGTLVHDITHSVAVTDFVHHKTIILHAGQSYLAHKP